VLAAGSASAWALDQYVVDHVEVADTDAFEAAKGSTGTSLDTSDAVATADSWSSDGTTITVTQQVIGSGDDQITYFVADLVLTDATVLRSGFADDEFGENIVANTSTIATGNDAVFAVNGDYYGFRDAGIEVRNGTLYRSEGAREGLVLYEDGRSALYDETTTSADTLVADGAWTTLSFGPAVVSSGHVVDGIEDVEIDTNFGNHSIQGPQPRTAIGVIDTNHLVVVVVDGRSTGYSRGATMTELADIFVGLGATTAYNLDGGGSSTMFFHGEVVNRPSEGHERGVSDILYVAG
jgi:exopolysaccharide biosynthesis protein